MIGYFGNSIMVHPQLNYKWFPMDDALVVSAKTHILANIVHMIISLGTCSKHKTYTPYRPTYTSLSLLLVQWLETNILHYQYASY